MSRVAGAAGGPMMPGSPRGRGAIHRIRRRGDAGVAERTNEYDVLILGSGPAANAASVELKEAGKTVALVERGRLGGCCSLRGCNPKKVLTNAAWAVDFARRTTGTQTAGGNGVRIDWPAAHTFQRTFTDPVPATRLEDLRDRGVVTFHGTARFVGENAVRVATGSNGNGGPTLRFGHCLIATGSQPTPLDIDGEELVSTSTDLLDLADLPPRVVFLGGGYISLESAHAALRADRAVTIVESSPHILGLFDDELADMLADRTRRLGAKIFTGCTVRAVRRRPDGSLVVEAEHDGETREIAADLVVHGGGRTPALDALDLEAAGVEAGKHGVAVDDTLRSRTNPRVLAAGDAADTGRPMLSPVAAAEGRAAGRTLATGEPTEPDVGPIAATTYTTPPLAAVGLTVAQADDRGVKYVLRSVDLSTKGTVRKLGETHAAVKVLLDPTHGRILGAHLLGPEAHEVINLFAAAVRFGIPLDDLRKLTVADPTMTSEVLGDLGSPS